MIETNRVEYKRELTKEVDLEKEVIAFVHNDYTTELRPKVEFFEGFSVPRNKELMRIYKDIGLVEQLGSGVPRIIEKYDKSCFKFSENFLRMTFHKNITNQVGNQVSNQVGNQVGNQVNGDALLKEYNKILGALNDLLKEVGDEPTENNLEKFKSDAEKLTESERIILAYCQKPKKRKEILEDCLKISNQTKNFKTNIEPLIERELIQLTIKDKPQSQHQKYLITSKGKVVLFIYNKTHE